MTTFRIHQPSAWITGGQWQRNLIVQVDVQPQMVVQFLKQPSRQCSTDYTVAELAIVNDAVLDNQTDVVQ